MKKKSALLLVDLQNDFCEHGSLAVPDGDLVIPIANDMMKAFEVVIATQDWHPENHVSFHTVWPVHCVQGSVGAAFHPALNTTNITKVVQKGLDASVDSYSAFYDNDHRLSTGLTAWLREHTIHDLYVMGLATDYCVKFSCLDAIQDGFNVHVIQAGCRGVNINPEDSINALHALQEKGCVLL